MLVPNPKGEAADWGFGLFEAAPKLNPGELLAAALLAEPKEKELALAVAAALVGFASFSFEFSAAFGSAGLALPKEKAEPDDFCSDDFDPKEKPPALAVEFFGDWLKAPKIEVAGFVSDFSGLEFCAGEPKLKPPKAEPRLSPAALS